MHINWTTLILQTINVLILVWLLGRFLFRPVMNAIIARQQAANKLLIEAQEAKQTAEARDAELKQRNEGFAAEAAQQRAAMQAEVDAERGKLLEQARGEAGILHDQAKAEIAAEQRRMAAELEQQAAKLAGHMAAMLLERLPAEQIAALMFEQLLAHLRGLPDIEREKLAQETDLVAALPMQIDAARQQSYAEALAAALPGLKIQRFIVDPAMLGGFELRGMHTSLRNSWRGDLDAMLQQLKDGNHARLG